MGEINRESTIDNRQSAIVNNRSLMVTQLHKKLLGTGYLSLLFIFVARLLD